MAERVMLVTAIIELYGHILLGYKEKHDDWTGPGGKINKGETDHEALKRETQEELDIGIDSLKKVGTYLFDSKGRSFERRVYSAKICCGIPTEFNDKTFKIIKFCKPEEIRKLRLAPSMKEAMEDYFKARTRHDD